MNFRNTIKSIPLTSNINIPMGDIGVQYILTGSPNLSGGGLSVATSGTPEEGTWLLLKYEVSPLSYNEGTGKHITIFGEVVAQEIASEEFLVQALYVNSAWHVAFLLHYDTASSAYMDGSIIIDDSIPTGKFADSSVTTAKIADGNVTDAKLADMADATLKGRAKGAGTGVSSSLDETDIRTILNQSVTLTGDITGTSVETFGTGNTSIATTIPAGSLGSAKLTTEMNTGVLIIPVSFEANEIGIFKIKMPFACTITNVYGSVSKLIEATNDASVNILNNSSIVMTGSVLTLPAGAVMGFSISSAVTANNLVAAADVLTITTAKSTAGGKAVLSVTYERR